MTSAEINAITLKNKVSKELRSKANDFLNNKVKVNNLTELIQYLEVGGLNIFAKQYRYYINNIIAL